MRSLFVACSLLAIVSACTERKIIVRPLGSTGQVPAEQTEEEPEDEAAETPDAKGPTLTDSSAIDLGDVQVGTDVPFEIPAGALGFNIVVEGKLADFDQSRPFGIDRITAPDGTVVHDGFTPRGGSNPTSFASFDVIAAASVPQGEGTPEDLEGTWKVRLGVHGSSAKPTLKAKVRVQSTSDGAFHGGQLDVHIHVPRGLRIGARAVDASKAESDPDIKERVDAFFVGTSQLLGIERGEVTFHEEAERYQSLNDNEVLAGFAVSSGQKDGTQALHILMTNMIASGGQPVAAGISPGIPGAATVFGRNVSGIIVTTSERASQDALTMLHEAGHFIGLNHTTEFNGQGSDPFEDTPFCQNVSRNPNDLFACPDRSNIMFVAGAIDGPVMLSPSQKRVYRGSPVYRALASSGGTRSISASTVAPTFKRAFRISGDPTLSPVERELSLGFCGLNPLDADGLVDRHGRDAAIAQLRAAAVDTDLAPYIRGRANLALERLGAP